MLTVAVVGDRVLSVPVPEGFDAGSSPRGLLLRPLSVLRASYDVTVTIEPAAALPAELPHLRRDAGTLVRYQLDREEGGSGQSRTICLEQLATLPRKADQHSSGLP